MSRLKHVIMWIKAIYFDTKTALFIKINRIVVFSLEKRCSEGIITCYCNSLQLYSII